MGIPARAFSVSRFSKRCSCDHVVFVTCKACIAWLCAFASADRMLEDVAGRLVLFKIASDSGQVVDQVRLTAGTATPGSSPGTSEINSVTTRAGATKATAFNRRKVLAHAVHFGNRCAVFSNALFRLVFVQRDAFTRQASKAEPPPVIRHKTKSSSKTLDQPTCGLRPTTCFIRHRMRGFNDFDLLAVGATP